MSTDYKAILNGNHNVLEIARVIARTYGGDHFQMSFGSDSTVDWGFGLGAGIDRGHMILTFDQEFSAEVKALRPWERKAHRIHRQMSVFSDGDCAGDYAEITTEPMTYVSLGHWGECQEIIDALVAHFGGYVNDEAGNQEWEALPEERIQQMRRIAAFRAERDRETAKRAEDRRTAEEAAKR